MTEQKEVFKQDLSKEEEPGGVFLLKLLFRQQPAWPRYAGGYGQTFGRC